MLYKLFVEAERREILLLENENIYCLARNSQSGHAQKCTNRTPRASFRSVFRAAITIIIIQAKTSASQEALAPCSCIYISRARELGKRVNGITHQACIKRQRARAFSPLGGASPCLEAGPKANTWGGLRGAFGVPQGRVSNCLLLLFLSPTLQQQLWQQHYFRRGANKFTCQANEFAQLFQTALNLN
jgi:hypothetical protein